MKAETRLFGAIDIEDNKIIRIENGMIGFPDMQNFALIYEEEKGKEAKIMWLQSMDEPEIAFPVMRPERVKAEYNPTVNDEVLEPLGAINEENMFVVVTLTAVADVKKNTVNLKAPIIINTETRKGCQIIVEDDYPVKYNIYEALKEKKEKAGE